MTLLQDGCIAFLAAVGLTTVVWLAAGAIFHAGRPAIPGLLLVLPLRDEALAMESDVRELRRVQGQLPGAKIILADCGLTPPASLPSIWRAVEKIPSWPTAGICK